MATNNAYTNAVTFGAVPILLDRETRKKFINVFRDEDFTDLMDQLGDWTPTAATLFSNVTEDALVNTVDTTGMTVATSGTTTITLTVVPANTFIPGQDFRFSNNSVGRVMTVTNSTTDTVVIKSVNATVITCTAGDILIPAGNSQEEGSDAPRPIRWNWTTTNNIVQIHSVKVSMTDIAMAQKYEVFDDANGNEQLVSYEVAKGFARHQADISLASWNGDISTTRFSDSSPTLAGPKSNGVQTTRGIESYIRLSGMLPTLSTPGTFTALDLETLNNTLDAGFGTMEYLVVGGGAAINRFTTYLKGLGSAGVVSARLEVNGRTTDMTVETWIYGGRIFHIKRMGLFTNSNAFNSTAQVTKNLYLIPMGKASTKQGDFSYVGMRYMPLPGGGGAGTPTYGEYHTGMLAPVPTNDTAEHGVRFHTIAGVEVLGASKFARWTVMP